MVKGLGVGLVLWPGLRLRFMVKGLGVGSWVKGLGVGSGLRAWA